MIALGLKRLAAALVALSLLVLPWQRPLDAAVTATPVFVQTPKITVSTFINGTDALGVYKTIYTGGSNGSKIVGIMVGNSDTVSHLFNVNVSTSTSSHCASASTCALGAGATLATAAGSSNAVPLVNMMSPTIWPGLPRDGDGNPFIFLSDNTQTLEGAYTTVFTTGGTKMTVMVIAADF